jgi:DNA-binding NarL/FixJ family response regulator
MVNEKLKELEALRAKTAELEQAVAAELKNELAGLSKKYGFDSAEAFIDAVRAASGSTGKRRGRPAKKAVASAPATGGDKKRRRAKITDETRNEVKALVKAGKTGNEIAKTLGISLPSVQNIKKALGLVQARK